MTITHDHDCPWTFGHDCTCGAKEMQKLWELPLKRDTPQFTYHSTQSTNCAVCGRNKHTPLRIDWMGGYVCLTCIDLALTNHDTMELVRARKALGDFVKPPFDGSMVTAINAVNLRCLSAEQALAKFKIDLKDSVIQGIKDAQQVWQKTTPKPSIDGVVTESIVKRILGETP